MDDAAGEFYEDFVDKIKAFEAYRQSPEVMRSRNGSLDEPAGFAKTAAIRLATSGDFGSNAGFVQRTAVSVVIVAPIALNEIWLLKRPAALARNIVTVGVGERYRKRHARALAMKR